MDGDLPLVTGHVPVELVVAGLELALVGVDEAERVRRGVLDGDRPDGVVGAGHPDLDPLVVAFPALLVSEGRSVLGGDGAYVQLESEVEAAGGPVDHGDIPVHPVPRARESESDRFGNVDPSALPHGDLCVEALDLELLRLSGQWAAARRQRDHRRQGDSEAPPEGSHHDRVRAYHSSSSSVNST